MPLMGFMSCGQADITTITSHNAFSLTRSCGLETVGSKVVLPFGAMGMFIHKLNGSGIDGA